MYPNQREIAYRKDNTSYSSLTNRYKSNLMKHEEIKKLLKYMVDSSRNIYKLD